MFKSYFSRMAKYNEWANKRLYSSCALLSLENFHCDRDIAFKSVCGTLNHLLVVDRIWMHRMTGKGETYTQLGEILDTGLDVLKKKRAEEDIKIIDFIDSMSEADFLGSFEYSNTAGQAFKSTYDEILAHFFNHQTHHRGQIHALLTQFGQDSTPLDLIYFIRGL